MGRLLLRLILSLFSSNIKGRYTNKLYYLTEFMAIFVSLLIYYFTSKAFSGHLSSPLQKYQTDYFSFIVYGEIFLSIPIFFLEGSFRQLETAYHEGIWETFDSLPITDVKKLMLIISYGLFPVILRTLITLILASTVFGLKLPFIPLLQCLYFQIISIPAFLAPGILACSIWIATGRGRGIIGYFTTILGLLSGSLFPLSVFPVWLEKLSYNISPFTFLLENSRMALLKSFSISEIFQKSLVMLLWAALLPLSFWCFKIAKKKYYQNDGINTMIS